MTIARLLLALGIAVTVFSCTVPTQPESTIPTDTPTGSLPAAPTGLVVTSSSQTTLSLRWDAADGALGYRVYRSILQTGSFLMITAVVAPACTYTDSGLQPGVTYFYKVLAYNGVGTGTFSAFAQGITQSPVGSLPEAPTGLAVGGATSSSLVISWDPVADATGYRLYISNTSSGEYALLFDGPLTSILNYALLSGTTHYYKVCAYNEYGSGLLTSWVAGTTLSGTHPYYGGIVLGNDGQYLGVINDNEFDQDSLANSFGTYGSVYSSYSIWNQFGTYGSQFSSLSAYNSFTSTPPKVYVNGVFYAYLTTNTIKIPRLDPNVVALAIGRTDVIR